MRCNFYYLGRGKRTGSIIIFLVFLVLFIFPNTADNYIVEAADKETEVVFPDQNLEKAIHKQLGKTSGKITVEELKNLKELKANNAGIENLTGLEYASNLEVLVLNTDYITDEEGNWIRNTVTDLSPLSNFKNLKVLELRNNKVQDVTPLSGLIKLEILDLSENQVINLVPIHNLQLLRKLNLGSNRELSNLTGLSGLTKLEELDLGGNNIRDISPLKDLPSLKCLYLYFNNIYDISPLGQLTALQELYLSGNMIKDVSGLDKLTDLKRLEINDNLLEDISLLKNLNKLQGLSLEGNRIADIYPLQKLSLLDWLDLDNNVITDITPLQNLSSLQNLFLRNNQIVDISPLASLVKLTHLELEQNQIENLSTLSRLDKLESLGLKNTGIEDVSCLENLQELEILNLSNNNIKDIAALAGFTRLVILDLSNNQIKDITSLVINSQDSGLGEGNSVCLKHNLLDLNEGSQNMNHLRMLEKYGVRVEYDPQGPEKAEYKPLTIMVNGIIIDSEIEPIIIDDRTLAPAELLAELIGVQMKQESNGVTVFTKENKTLVITPGNPKVLINEIEKDLVVSSIIKDNQLLIPLRMFAETYGAGVGWNEEQHSVSIELNEVYNGLTPDQYLDKCQKVMSSLKSYKFQGKLTTQVNNIERLIDIEGFYHGNDVYLKMIMHQASEKGEDISSEYCIIADQGYYRLYEKEWQHLPLSLPRELDIDSSINAPGEILNNIENFGQACSFTDKINIDNKSCITVNVCFDKARYVQKYIDFLQAVMEDPTLPYNLRVSYDNIESFQKHQNELRCMCLYNLNIEEDSNLLRSLRICSTRGFSEEFKVKNFIEFTIYDFNKSVKMPTIKIE